MTCQHCSKAPCECPPSSAASSIAGSAAASLVEESMLQQQPASGPSASAMDDETLQAMRVRDDHAASPAEDALAPILACSNATATAKEDVADSAIEEAARTNCLEKIVFRSKREQSSAAAAAPTSSSSATDSTGMSSCPPSPAKTDNFGDMLRELVELKAMPGDDNSAAKDQGASNAPRPAKVKLTPEQAKADQKRRHEAKHAARNAAKQSANAASDIAINKFMEERGVAGIYAVLSNVPDGDTTAAPRAMAARSTGGTSSASTMVKASAGTGSSMEATESKEAETSAHDNAAASAASASAHPHGHETAASRKRKNEAAAVSAMLGKMRITAIEPMQYPHMDFCILAIAAQADEITGNTFLFDELETPQQLNEGTLKEWLKGAYYQHARPGDDIVQLPYFAVIDVTSLDPAELVQLHTAIMNYEDCLASKLGAKYYIRSVSFVNLKLERNTVVEILHEYPPSPFAAYVKASSYLKAPSALSSSAASAGPG